jgi:SAM-dependent methyltransferase
VTEIRATAHGFDRIAGAYEHARPGYPTAAVDRLVAELGIGPHRVVVDVGAGTGKLTRELSVRGAQVVAVEPLRGMRAQLTRVLPGIPLLADRAEAIRLPDGSADAVTVAQAFHWFDAPAALTEFHRLLGPHGRLGILFNRRDLDDPLQAAIDRLLRPHWGDTPSWATHDWSERLDAAQGPTPWFEPADRTVFPHAQDLEVEGLVARVASISFVGLLDQHTRADVLRRVAELANDHGDDGRVQLRYRTELRLLRRRGER